MVHRTTFFGQNNAAYPAECYYSTETMLGWGKVELYVIFERSEKTEVNTPKDLNWLLVNE